MGVTEHDRELEAIRFEIARAAPAFESERIVPLGEGMDSLAILVGEDFVFRFLKHAQAAAGLRREINLLPRLAPTLNLKIPRFEYAGVHSVTGLPFVGYRLIRGEPLHQQLFDALTGEAQGAVLGDLASFLKAVHAFPVDEAKNCGVVPEESRADFAETLGQARADVLPRLDSMVRRKLESHLGAFLEDDRNFDYAPALLHGDLWPEHVLFSPARECLTGVIDWGDVSIGDPDYDLAFLAQRLGPSFIDGLLGHYHHSDPARLFEKIRSMIIFNAIEDVFIGLERGDLALVDSALADLSS